MEIIDEPTRIIAFDGEHMASVELVDRAGTLSAGNLASNGSAQCLLAVVRRAVSRGRRMYLVVDDESPVRDKLERLYRRVGAVYSGKVFKVN